MVKLIGLYWEGVPILFFRSLQAALGFLAFVLLLSACSSSNTESPPPGEAHIDRFLLSHSSEAKIDLNDCKKCHRSDFPGTPNVTSCLECHTDGHPFVMHPLPYDDPSLHGPSALMSQKACLGCHGSLPNQFDGGILSDPDLYARQTGNCSRCHATAGAHPTNWLGKRIISSSGYNASHRAVSAKSIAESCALCHQVTPDSAKPVTQAPSCFSAGYTNGEGLSSGCHAGGFGNQAHVMPFAEPDLHGSAAKADLTTCQSCHGTNNTIAFDGGTATTACSTCHSAAGAHPTNWLAGNDPSPEHVSNHSNSQNQSSTCAICHDVTQGRTAPNSEAPSCFSATFTNSDGSTSGCHAAGPSAPHALPFTNPDLHGPEAKKDLNACVSCHATPADAGPGDNPRFNRSIGNLVTGCEDCHNQQTAHPVPQWSNAGDSGHASAGNLAVACALCHGSDLSGPAGGGVATACSDCHTAGSPLTLIGCTSCHSQPPDGDTAPNRDAAHVPHIDFSGLGDDCRACHDGSGNGTAVHLSNSSQDVRLLALYTAKSGGVTQYDPGSMTCSNVSCHGGQTTPSWNGGSIDVQSDCLDCHSAGTEQYNSFNDAAHNVGAHSSFSCIACHDPVKLAGTHFTNLASPGFDGSAADSIRFGGYNPGCGGTNGCHD